MTDYKVRPKPSLNWVQWWNNTNFCLSVVGHALEGQKEANKQGVNKQAKCSTLTLNALQVNEHVE
jgi:hypothetical protein